MPSPGKVRVGDDAQVLCPLRSRFVDLEVCLACGLLEDVQLDRRPLWMECRGTSGADVYAGL